MKLAKRQRPFGTDINIAPLIDVVFLLIIFFMTVSQMTKLDVEEVTLPEARKGTQPPELAVGRLVVNLRTDGTIVVGRTPCTPERLRAIVAREAKTRGDAELTVLVRGDRDAPWNPAAAILRACAQARIHRVRVAVIDTPDAP